MGGLGDRERGTSRRPMPGQFCREKLNNKTRRQLIPVVEGETWARRFPKPLSRHRAASNVTMCVGVRWGVGRVLRGGEARWGKRNSRVLEVGALESRLRHGGENKEKEYEGGEEELRINFVAGARSEWSFFAQNYISALY